ncbi:nitroreductase family protein [Candidatus Riflebacteria bacterium]
MGSLKELVKKNRSYRRFHEDEKIERETLIELLELARLTPSAHNKQPLKYFLSHTKEHNELIFPHLAWAGYLKDWPGPPEGERPSAYIVILNDKEIADDCFCDHGITAQTILLGAMEKNLGGCMIGAFKKKALKKALELPHRFEIVLVLALGKPKELVQIDKVKADGDIKYWRDKEGVHHVPKRAIEEIILNYKE